VTRPLRNRGAGGTSAGRFRRGSLALLPDSLTLACKPTARPAFSILLVPPPMNSHPPSFPSPRAPQRLGPLAGASLTLALCVTAPLAAYNTAYAQTSPAAGQPAAGSGRIVGRVVDANTGAGISDVQVRVEGTTLGALSGVDGRFTVTGVPAGAASLQVRRIGFQAKTVTGVTVAAGRAVEQNVSLTPATVQLAAVSVTASAERGTVNAALDQQRNAVAVVSAISSEQIARSPDSDAAQAVQRVSGVTVQEGRYVVVRGLSERYTTASLNGARLPSPEPDRKVVPLDLFPASLLQSVTTSKTFTPDQQGDFSGALVNIQTREFPAERQIQLSTTVGYNPRATGQDLPLPRGAGLESFALGSRNRALPSMVRNTNFGGPVAPGTATQLVQSFRDVWSPREGRGLPSNSYSASVGGSDPVFGRQIGYVLSGTYSYSQEVLDGFSRGQALAGGQQGVVNEVDRYDGVVGRAGVLWGGIANLSTLFGGRTRVSLNNTYNRTADDEARTERGFSENLGTALDVRRLRYVERSVRSNQLAVQHTANERHQLDGYITSSGVTRSEPDRSEFVQIVEDDAQGREQAPAWLSVNNEGAVRTFGELSESNVEGALNYRLSFGPPARQWAVKAGGLFRATNRDARNDVFSLVANLPVEQRRLAPEEIFSTVAAQAAPGTFNIIPLSQGGSYEASDRLAAGYLMADGAITSRVRVVGGARVEHSDVTVDAQPTIGAAIRTQPQFTDVLPSLTVNVALSDRQTVRLSGSQTLARPEYRELAPIQFRDVIGGDNVIGNAQLRRTLIRNADARWEFYPNPGEVLSVGVFGKWFDDPIERLYLATSGTRVVTFANAERATNYGVELEARKGLGFLASALEPLSAFSNVTLIRSDISLGNTGASLSSPNRAMVGQAPYVVNAGLTYATLGGASATLLYNVVGERIVNAAEAPLPDVRERPRHVVDFSIRAPLYRSLNVRLDARNLLDAPFQLFQGTALRERYRTGRIVQLGFTWRPTGGSAAEAPPAQTPP